MDLQEAPQEFYDEVAEKINGIKAIVKKYGLEDQYTQAFIGGIYTENEDGSTKIKTILDYVVVDEEELEEVLSIALTYYQEMEKTITPMDVSDTKDWTHEDWMKYINDNTDGTANS